VLGDFPMQADDALISITWLETAKNRKGGENGDLYAGVGVGGPGDPMMAFDTHFSIFFAREKILPGSPF